MAQVVFVVHGMGNDAGTPKLGPAVGWAAEVEQTLRDAARAYPAIDQAELIVEPVLYDDVFQRYATTWEAVANQLEGTPLARLTAFMRNASQGDFLWGSVGDVVQYRALALVRENVKSAVAAQIARAVAKHGTMHHYSILAHSLGTAVAHDAVSALAQREVRGSTVLNPPDFRFSNYFALANVSKLVWATDADFYQTTCVRPLDSGLPFDRCAVNHYLDFRHIADPIASLVRFAPRGWSAERFVPVPLQHFRDLNVHGFVHYLKAPMVSDRILARLFPAAMDRTTFAARLAAFPDYLDPLAAEKRLAVQSVDALLKRMSGQLRGKLELDIDALVRALWKSRKRLREALS